jgi:hypothetical protein
MNFSDDHLHDGMKLALDTLVNIINQSDDMNQKGNAAIQLANLILEIYDRQNPDFILEDEVEDFEDEDDIEGF